jgi:hypothetical protein
MDKKDNGLFSLKIICLNYGGFNLFQMAKRSEGIVYAVINGTRQHWKDKQIFSAYMMDR